MKKKFTKMALGLVCFSALILGGSPRTDTGAMHFGWTFTCLAIAGATGIALKKMDK